MKEKHQLKILLLQIREDEETMLEEFYEFVQFSQLHEEQFTKLNTFKTIHFPPSIMDDYDVLFVGGSSDASVLNVEDYLFVPHCKALIRYCYDNNIPVLASCFGFQIAMEELGGKVILDKENMEMGIYSINLHSEVKDDPLLYDYPESFWAVSGHKERANKIPSNCILLASSERCPYHIVKFIDKPIYCFQFHPEVDTKDLITRITRYQMRYLDNNESLQEIIDTAIHETPYSNKIVKDFIERIVLPHYNG
ncbi:type 1 glutamine amidotransferase [Legionella impletisoli]|uniref:Aminotransferase n=1 Tax=Legionella impletisoli TaxID=343510 RepID=A0A917JU10_9GAMM|nr:type 1 glutamine amidotransferase [Legionella impletisoli]GGI81155.1 aminotransferase [Legionella impletisoli]